MKCLENQIVWGMALMNMIFIMMRGVISLLLSGGCKKSCVYGEIIFPDMSQICRNLLSNITTFMLSNFFSDDSIANLLHPIHVF